MASGGHLCLLCLLSSMVLISIKTSDAILWTSQPVDLQQCAGRDVIFGWHYDVNRTSHVSMMFWLFMGTGETMMGWEAHRAPIVYESYKGRVQLLPHYNAGIQLLNVTTADSGEYKLELAGPGVIDKTSLKVYNESELIPKLKVDDILVNFDEILTLNISDRILFELSTGSSITAESIVFRVKDNNEEHEYACHNDTACEYIRSFNNAGNVTLHITVTYPFCTPIDKVLYMDIHGAVTSSDATNIIIIAISISAVITTLLVITIVLIIKCRLKKNNTKNDEQIQYTTPQRDRYSEKQLLKGVSEHDTGDKQSQPNVHDEQMQPHQTDDQSVPGDNPMDDNMKVLEHRTSDDSAQCASMNAAGPLADDLTVITYSADEPPPTVNILEAGFEFIKGIPTLFCNTFSSTNEGSIIKEMSTATTEKGEEPHEDQ